MRITTDHRTPTRGMEVGPVEPTPHIGLRWWVDRAATLHYGWPDAGSEDACLAIGWVAADDPIGVIEASDLGATRRVLNTLEARFPGRRWFEGDWAPRGVEVRRAA